MIYNAAKAFQRALRVSITEKYLPLSPFKVVSMTIQSYGSHESCLFAWSLLTYCWSLRDGGGGRSEAFSSSPADKKLIESHHGISLWLGIERNDCWKGTESWKMIAVGKAGWGGKEKEQAWVSCLVRMKMCLSDGDEITPRKLGFLLF